VVGAARVDPLERVGHVEVATGGQPGLLQQRHQALPGGAGIGGGLEHHELAGPQHPCEGGSRRHERPEVGLPVASERRGHCDQHRVGLGQLLVATGGVQVVTRRAKAVVRHILDLALAPADRGHAPRIGVDACHLVALLGERQGQWQPHIPEAHDADLHGLARGVAREGGAPL
jgi:hypothetical protein